ncbi:MAG: DUF3152 domain-containing protein [Actinomycetes bacterium]
MATALGAASDPATGTASPSGDATASSAAAAVRGAAPHPGVDPPTVGPRRAAHPGVDPPTVEPTTLPSPEPAETPEPATPEAATPSGGGTAPGTTDVVGTGGRLTTYVVEVEPGTSPETPASFAAQVDAALLDPTRGWTARGSHRLQRVDDPAAADLVVLLASPATVDRICARAGLRTGGIFSCWSGRTAAINARRWHEGARDHPDLARYRVYVANHEVGHGLGHGHVDCPGAGRPAPVMMQQTKTVGACTPNGWPYPG